MELEEYKKNIRRIVLIGGGHSNVQVMLELYNEIRYDENIEVYLISNYRYAYYSGMMPGCVAGIYNESQTRMDLKALSDWCGIKFINDIVYKIDKKLKHIYIKNNNNNNNNVINYDYLSINIGSTTKGLDIIPGANEYTLATRPISEMMAKLTSFEDKFFHKNNNNNNNNNKINTYVVGGGAAGVELCMTLYHRWKHINELNEINIHLIDDHKELLAGMGKKVSKKTTNAFNDIGIKVFSTCRVKEITKESIIIENSATKHIESFDYDLIVWATGAAAHSCTKDYDIECNENGFIIVKDTLQSISDPNIFASGDCCHMKDYSYVSKAGVYAVRQGPYVAKNLISFIRRQSLQQYIPQRSFLALLADGKHGAILRYKSFAFYSRWCWWLKDWIDKSFMKRFDTSLFKESHSELIQDHTHNDKHNI